MAYYGNKYNILESYNDSIEYDCQLAVPDDTRWFLILGFCVIMLVTLSGNFIVILVLGIVKNLKNDLNNYLLNLAVADLLVATFCMPAKTFYMMSENWVLGKAACSLFISVQHVSRVRFFFSREYTRPIYSIYNNMLDSNIQISTSKCDSQRDRQIC